MRRVVTFMLQNVAQIKLTPISTMLYWV